MIIIIVMVLCTPSVNNITWFLYGYIRLLINNDLFDLSNHKHIFGFMLNMIQTDWHPYCPPISVLYSGLQPAALVAVWMMVASSPMESLLARSRRQRWASTAPAKRPRHACSTAFVELNHLGMSKSVVQSLATVRSETNRGDSVIWLSRLQSTNKNVPKWFCKAVLQWFCTYS